MKPLTACLLFSGCLLLSLSALGNNQYRAEDISWITTFPDSVETYQARLEQLDNRIIQQPGATELYLERGAVHLGLHDFDRAIDDFNRAINRADMDAAYYGRGLAKGRLREFDGALADMTIYISRHPDSSVAYTKRGIRNLWNGDRDTARADFLKALELDPDNTEANDDIGVMYAQEQDYEQAITHFKKTISVDPTYHKAYHNLAMAYYLTDRNLAALSTVDQGIALLPGARDSLLLKAEILKALGQTEQARVIREQADRLDSGDWSERVPVR